ncbi:polygalacturonase ADPG1 [Selaginella moellendorffii]|uniref:polygalacturonase ADPG1 n=1 Tax=Selaginella moellendorffii TaxID=88036 RepID=UPI000D1CC8C0|nr:polygalacturonase ADPG1 [Selaginella moellendorffii]|eukprot:XP_024523934.1 polygalacturonase ADPG1 [Selaginella moellendorffii]
MLQRLQRSPPPFEDEPPLPPHHAPKPPKAPKAPKAPKVKSPPPAKAPPPPSVTLPRSPPPPRSSSPLTGKEFDVKSYGAVGDGKHDDAQVDGTLHAIPRSAWLSKFSSEKSWLLFTKVTDFTLTGGTFNGNGQDWWAHSCKKDKSQAVRFEDSKNIKVEGITITNSPQIHITFSDSQAIQATNVVINSPESSPNTDGIHVSGSTNVVVRDGDISAGNFPISDSDISVLTIFSLHTYLKVTTACRLFLGAPTSRFWAGDAALVTASASEALARAGLTPPFPTFKSQGGKGYVSNVIFENISMDNVKNPIIIDQNYCDGGCGKKRGVTYSNIVGTSASPDGINLHCSSSGACTNIHFSNVKLTLGSSGKSSPSLLNHSMSRRNAEKSYSSERSSTERETKIACHWKRKEKNSLPLVHHILALDLRDPSQWMKAHRQSVVLVAGRTCAALLRNEDEDPHGSGTCPRRENLCENSSQEQRCDLIEPPTQRLHSSFQQPKP